MFEAENSELSEKMQENFLGAATMKTGMKMEIAPNEFAGGQDWELRDQEDSGIAQSESRHPSAQLGDRMVIPFIKMVSLEVMAKFMDE